MLQMSASPTVHRCFCGRNVNTSRRAFCSARPRTVVRAEENRQAEETRETKTESNETDNNAPSRNGSEKKKGPRLSFAPNTRSVSVSCPYWPVLLQCSARLQGMLPLLQGMGYTEDDSAGQTNIFAIEVCLKTTTYMQLIPFPLLSAVALHNVTFHVSAYMSAQSLH